MTEPHYSDDDVTVYAGDCLAMLRAGATFGYDFDLGYEPTRLFPDASVDAVVCDPPYGLGFMGKTWDATFTAADVPMRRNAAMDSVNTGASRQGGRQRACEDYAKRQARDAQAFGEWCEAWAVECLRVLKPGGHLLAFGGTRTYHRLACAVEDAGFEIRDSISWLYGSGFPKSLDVSKAIDRAAGAERDVVGRKLNPDGTTRRDSSPGSRHGRGWTMTWDDDPSAIAAKALETAPATDAAKQWQGWGTALKPAHEPIVVARKPSVGTVAGNVAEHGTGAINIDACRVDTAGEVTARPPLSTNKHEGWQRPWNEDTAARSRVEATREIAHEKRDVLGRWPTNVVLDESQAEALDAQTGDRPNGNYPAARTPNSIYGGGRGTSIAVCGSDEHLTGTGGASRFFPTFRYEAKAPSTERPSVNGVLHPTVKPLDLMRWLVRLVTPPGGLVLDPFLGSGTTAEACILENLRCIGIEREPDYLPLIVQRLSKPLALGFDFGDEVGA